MFRAECPMDDDYSLLQRYVRERSDAAFETLMQRHADLVYSSALRLTSDPHLAEDVTQAVFIVLARKAPQLKANVVLPAWLLSVTKLTAANARRDKNRQHRHEQENATLNANRDSTNRSGGEWLQLAPMLDGALEQLSESDRAAVVLRYFKRCSIGELAAQLHVSEAAADKRVLRALEKLRGFLTKRGLTLSALGLAVLLTENSVHAAPPTLATVFPQVLAAAHGGIHVSNGVVLANGALKAMSIVSTKQLAACAAIFLCLGVAGGLSVKYWNARPAVTAGALAPTITDRKEWPLPDQAPDTDGVRVENPPAPTPIPAVVAVPPANQEVPVAAGGPPETLQPANNQSVNMLALANAAADSINGVWSIAGGELVTHERTAVARFEFPFIPPGEYDFKLDFTVLEARGDVAMILAKNGKQFVWKMGALGNHVNAFESIGTIGDQNHTRRTYPKVFEKDKRYQAVVQVRDRWVAAYFNGKLESWHATDYTDFDFYKFWKLPHPDTLGVGVWATSIQVHSAELAEMPGGAHCRALREPGEQPTPREQPQLTDEKLWANAVNLLPLIDPNRDAVTGRWSLSANGLDCLKTLTARLEIPYQPPAEYDLKTAFPRQAGAEH